MLTNNSETQDQIASSGGGMNRTNLETNTGLKYPITMSDADPNGRDQCPAQEMENGLKFPSTSSDADPDGCNQNPAQEVENGLKYPSTSSDADPDGRNQDPAQEVKNELKPETTGEMKIDNSGCIDEKKSLETGQFQKLKAADFTNKDCGATPQHMDSVKVDEKLPADKQVSEGINLSFNGAREENGAVAPNLFASIYDGDENIIADGIEGDNPKRRLKYCNDMNAIRKAILRPDIYTVGLGMDFIARSVNVDNAGFITSCGPMIYYGRLRLMIDNPRTKTVRNVGGRTASESHLYSGMEAEPTPENYSIIPRLKRIASIRFAFSLLKDKPVIYSMKRAFYEMRYNSRERLTTVLEEAIARLETLTIPISIDTRLTHWIVVVMDDLARWITVHNRFLDKKKSLNVECRLEGVLDRKYFDGSASFRSRREINFVDFVDCVTFNHLGAIDYAATARNLITQDRFCELDKYLLATQYCLLEERFAVAPHISPILESLYFRNLLVLQYPTMSIGEVERYLDLHHEGDYSYNTSTRNGQWNFDFSRRNPQLIDYGHYIHVFQALCLGPDPEMNGAALHYIWRLLTEEQRSSLLNFVFMCPCSQTIYSLFLKMSEMQRLWVFQFSYMRLLEVMFENSLLDYHFSSIATNILEDMELPAFHDTCTNLMGTICSDCCLYPFIKNRNRLVRYIKSHADRSKGLVELFWHCAPFLLQKSFVEYTMDHMIVLIPAVRVQY